MPEDNTDNDGNRTVVMTTKIRTRTMVISLVPKTTTIISKSTMTIETTKAVDSSTNITMTIPVV